MSLFHANLSKIQDWLSSRGIPIPAALCSQQPASSVSDMFAPHQCPLRFGDTGKKNDKNSHYRLAYVEDSVGVTVQVMSWRDSSVKSNLFIPSPDSIARAPKSHVGQNSTGGGVKKFLDGLADGIHEYLDGKGLDYGKSVDCLGMGLKTIMGNSNLVIPLTDGLEDVFVCSLEKRMSQNRDIVPPDAVQVIYWDGESFVKRKHGNCVGKWYVYMGSRACENIIVCEGIATGLTIFQCLQANNNVGFRGIRDMCIVCTCGAVTGAHIDNMRAELGRDYRGDSPQMWICADNDWHKAEDNAGSKNLERWLEAFPKAIPMQCPTSGVMIGEKPATDFNDLMIVNGEAYVVDAFFFNKNFPAQKEWDELFSEQGNTGFSRIDRFLNSGAKNKIILNKFPRMLLEAINVQGSTVRDKDFSQFVFAKIVQEMGLIGSQMYFDKGATRLYAGIMAFFVGPSTSGKSYVIDAGRIGVNVVGECVSSALDDIYSKIADVKIKIDAAKRRFKALPRGSSSKVEVAMLDEECLCAELELSQLELKKNFFDVIRPTASGFTIEAVYQKLSVARSVVIWSQEYRSLFGSLKRQLKGDSPTITLINISGGEDAANITKNNGSLYCNDICASMAFGSTAGSLAKCFTSDDFESGFMGRCLFSSCELGVYTGLVLKKKGDASSGELASELSRCPATLRLGSVYKNSIMEAMRRSLELGRLVAVGKGIEYSYNDEEDVEFCRIYSLFSKYLDHEIDSGGFGGNAISFRARYLDFFIKLCMYFTFFDVVEFDLSGESGQPVKLTPNSAYAAAAVLRHCINSAKVVLPSVMSRSRSEVRMISSDKAKALREFVEDNKDKSISYENMRHQIRLGALNGFETKDLLPAFDELVEQGVLRVAKDDSNRKKKLYKVCEGQ